MQEIKVIIFDLGGVIFENGTKNFRKFLTENYSVKDELLKELFYGEKSQLFRAGKINSVEFWNYIDFTLKNNNINIKKENLRDIWYNFYKPNGKIFELLSRLGQKYELGVVSGNIKERVLFLDKKYNFRKYFNWEIYSFDVGKNKPDINLYKVIFTKTNNLPKDCLYIDDKDIFLAPAKELGIKTILFENYDKLTSDLTNLNIIL